MVRQTDFSKGRRLKVTEMYLLAHWDPKLEREVKVWLGTGDVLVYHGQEQPTSLMLPQRSMVFHRYDVESQRNRTLKPNTTLYIQPEVQKNLYRVFIVARD